MSNAAKHYHYYPSEILSAPCWAYGFRIFFLILPWYIALITPLWGLSMAGILPPLPLGDPLLWHIYELLYGVGFGGIAAFLLTALPELFPGVVPIVGRRLQWLVGLWILGRVSLAGMAIFGVFSAAILNLLFSLILILWVFKPVVLDPLQRHASIAYLVVFLTILQGAFFASLAGIIPSVSPLEWLYGALSGFMALILVAFRRVQTETINENMEANGLEDLYIARPYRYNLAVFTILLFSASEFLALGSPTGWLALAAGSAILGILNDYKLRFEGILHLPYVIFFGSILVIMAGGYLGLGVAYLADMSYLSYARHALTVGAFGGAFLIVMVVVAFVHTGRKVSFDSRIALAAFLLLGALAVRVAGAFGGFFAGGLAHGVSALLFAASFIVYYYRFKEYLKNRRADGVAG